MGLVSYAQIDTDRPAFTNTVSTVSQKAFQVEAGFEYFTQQGYSSRPIKPNGPYLARQDAFFLPFGIVRIGVSKQAEFRIELPSTSFIRSNFSNDSSDGFSSETWNRQIGVGLKHQIINNQKFRLSNLVTLRSNRDYSILSEREVTFDLSNDVLWDYRINEKSKVAGVIGLANGRDAYFVNAAALYGRTFGENLWIQSEIVLQSTFFKDSRFNWQANTLNLSGQYTLTKQDAIDLTLGSVFRSTFLLSPNFSVQLGYAHLFNSNK